MKAHRHFSRGEPRRMGNVVIIASMLFSLLFLSYIKSRYCVSPSSSSSHGVFCCKFVGFSLFLFLLLSFTIFYCTHLGLN
jgi:hypothetical protein